MKEIKVPVGSPVGEWRTLCKHFETLLRGHAFL